ncbi:histone-fold-containing protein [Peziza echinospora]|nr:histone-fold-containing protein [Peziza echinospora]
MPRKSDVGPIPGAGVPPLADTKENGGLSIDDNVLPKSIVTRLAKGVLPQNTNIQKDATLALTKGATVFINYLCATANENAAKNSRKTINPKDILEAISQLELDDFRPRLEAELNSKKSAPKSEPHQRKPQKIKKPPPPQQLQQNLPATPPEKPPPRTTKSPTKTTTTPTKTEWTSNSPPPKSERRTGKLRQSMDEVDQPNPRTPLRRLLRRRRRRRRRTTMRVMIRRTHRTRKRKMSLRRKRMAMKRRMR